MICFVKSQPILSMKEFKILIKEEIKVNFICSLLKIFYFTKIYAFVVIKCLCKTNDIFKTYFFNIVFI